MSKQTAVEWLVEQLAIKLGTPMAITFYIDHAEEIEQSKAMEREQIVDAFQTEWSQHNYSGEQYYANTYGKEASHEA